MGKMPQQLKLLADRPEAVDPTCLDGEGTSPLTAGYFCLHNGFTMLRRFDRSRLLLGQTARVLAGPGQPLKAAREDGSGDSGSKFDTGTITRTKPKTQRPNLYRVLLLNDDYTPMEFVVLVLQDVFNKSREDAMRIMLHVHNKGVGECGVYPYEVAETKVTRVMDTARKNQHPLQCVMEKQ
jgi:ATP-dependent Clp protease adaptor protein ClpS